MNAFAFRSCRLVQIVAIMAMSCGLCATAHAQALERQVANIGWATQNGGTSGGSAAAANRVYTVSSRQQLIDAITQAKNEPKILRVTGLIDFREGREYSSLADQTARGVLDLPSNTTLIGVASNAAFVATTVRANGTSNIIIRNLTIENPWDVAPQDAANAEWDGITIVNGASNIWVDHVTTTDGSRTRDQTPGQEHHDGSIDITKGSNYVTVSYSLLRMHDKTMLIGSSDNEDTGVLDRGRLKVTLAYDMWENVMQRTPRVRFGQVHSYNNYFIGSRSHPAYNVGSLIGVGLESAIILENGVFDIDKQHPAKVCKLIDIKKGTVFKPVGNIVNGVATDLSCTLSPNVGWTPPYAYTLLPAAQTKEYVIANAGAGKLTAASSSSAVSSVASSAASSTASSTASSAASSVASSASSRASSSAAPSSSSSSRSSSRSSSLSSSTSSLSSSRSSSSSAANDTYCTINACVNYSLQGTATASTQSGSSRTAAMAIDGNTTTRWEASSSGSGTWLQVSLPAAKSLMEISVTEYGDRIRGYRLEYLSGGSWVTLNTGTTLGTRRIAANITTTAVRLVTTASASGQPSIAELQLLGKP